MVGSRLVIMGVLASLLTKSCASNVFQLRVEIDEEQKAGITLCLIKTKSKGVKPFSWKSSQ